MRLVPKSAPPLLLVILLGLLAGVPTSQADLYQWTDAEGMTHYTNEPRPDADPVGHDPVALEPEGSSEANTTDRIRRERLERGEATRWVDSQRPFPNPSMNDEGQGPDATESGESENRLQPAMPAKNANDVQDAECLALHQMSCLRVRAWLQVHGFDCDPGLRGQACWAPAKAAIEKNTKEARRRELKREDEVRERAATPHSQK